MGGDVGDVVGRIYLFLEFSGAVVGCMVICLVLGFPVDCREGIVAISNVSLSSDIFCDYLFAD